MESETFHGMESLDELFLLGESPAADPQAASERAVPSQLHAASGQVDEVVAEDDSYSEKWESSNPDISRMRTRSEEFNVNLATLEAGEATNSSRKTTCSEGTDIDETTSDDVKSELYREITSPEGITKPNNDAKVDWVEVTTTTMVGGVNNMKHSPNKVEFSRQSETLEELEDNISNDARRKTSFEMKYSADLEALTAETLRPTLLKRFKSSRDYCSYEQTEEQPEDTFVKCFSAKSSREDPFVEKSFSDSLCDPLHSPPASPCSLLASQLCEFLLSSGSSSYLSYSDRPPRKQTVKPTWSVDTRFNATVSSESSSPSSLRTSFSPKKHRYHFSGSGCKKCSYEKGRKNNCDKVEGGHCTSVEHMCVAKSSKVKKPHRKHAYAARCMAEKKLRSSSSVSVERCKPSYDVNNANIPGVRLTMEHESREFSEKGRAQSRQRQNLGQRLPLKENVLAPEENTDFSVIKKGRILNSPQPYDLKFDSMNSHERNWIGEFSEGYIAPESSEHCQSDTDMFSTCSPDLIKKNEIKKENEQSTEGETIRKQSEQHYTGSSTKDRLCENEVVRSCRRNVKSMHESTMTSSVDKFETISPIQSRKRCVDSPLVVAMYHTPNYSELPFSDSSLFLSKSPRTSEKCTYSLSAISLNSPEVSAESALTLTSKTSLSSFEQSSTSSSPASHTIFTLTPPISPVSQNECIRLSPQPPLELSVTCSTESASANAYGETAKLKSRTLSKSHRDFSSAFCNQSSSCCRFRRLKKSRRRVRSRQMFKATSSCWQRVRSTVVELVEEGLVVHSRHDDVVLHGVINDEDARRRWTNRSGYDDGSVEIQKWRSSMET